MWFNVYFNWIFCRKFSLLIWCIAYNNFCCCCWYFHYYIPLLYSIINLRLSIVFSLFFWKYMSFFRYFIRYFFIMLICNCLWIILNFLKLLWFFDIPLLYYYITLSSSIISYLSIILECELCYERNYFFKKKVYYIPKKIFVNTTFKII